MAAKPVVQRRTAVAEAGAFDRFCILDSIKGSRHRHDDPDPTRVASRHDFGHELTKLRIYADLTVRDVARTLGVPASTLGGYFSGTHLPALRPPGLLENLLKACGVDGTSEFELWRQAYWRAKRATGRDSGADPSDMDVATKVPISPGAPALPLLVSTRAPVERLESDPVLRGRDELVDRLVAATTDPAESASRVHVLRGMGGSGKSAIALTVADRVMAYGTRTWWVSADSAEIFYAGMYAVAFELGARAEQLHQVNLVDLVWRLLGDSPDPWLLILDNADDLTGVLALPGQRITDGSGWLRRPQGNRGSILLTTRDASAATWGRKAPSWLTFHAVGGLTADNGAEVLLELATEMAGSYDDAVELSGRLGGLPLGLTLAGRYLAEAGAIPKGIADPHMVRGFTEYRAALNRGRAESLRSGPADQILSHRQARQNLVSTWELSLDQLAARGLGEAGTLLRLMSSLLTAPVPYEILLKPAVLARSALFNGITGRRLWDLLHGLEGLGLVSLRSERAEAADEVNLLTIHPVVRDAARSHHELRQDPERYLTLLLELLELAADNIDPGHPSAWGRWRLLVDHCEAPLDLIAEHRLTPSATPVAALELAARAAGYLRAAGHPAQAVQRYLRLRRLARTALEAKHPLVYAIQHGLARAKHDLGQLESAEKDYREVLLAREKLMGPDHPDTLTTQHYLARTLRDLGRYSEAGRRFRRNLKVRQTTLGPDHPDTLTSLNGVADVLRLQGKSGPAEELYRQVLALRTKILGSDHPATLVTRHYLATLLHGRGSLDTAEAELRELLKTNRVVRGEAHPRTLAVWQSLVDVLHDQGRLDEAEHLARGLLTTREQILGAGHPATLVTRHRLGLILLDRNEIDAAESEIRAVHISRQRTLGLTHPSTVLAQKGLTAIDRRRGNATSSLNCDP